MNAVTMFDVAPRVAAGATFLDRTFPAGWVSEEMFKTLDIGDPELCALAQLFENFEGGAREVKLLDEDAIAYGFLSSIYAEFGDPHTEEVIAEYELLTKAWKREIESRLRRGVYVRAEPRQNPLARWFLGVFIPALA